MGGSPIRVSGQNHPCNGCCCCPPAVPTLPHRLYLHGLSRVCPGPLQTGAARTRSDGGMPETTGSRKSVPWGGASLVLGAVSLSLRLHDGPHGIPVDAGPRCSRSECSPSESSSSTSRCRWPGRPSSRGWALVLMETNLGVRRRPSTLRSRPSRWASSTSWLGMKQPAPRPPKIALRLHALCRPPFCASSSWRAPADGFTNTSRKTVPLAATRVGGLKALACAARVPDARGGRFRDSRRTPVGLSSFKDIRSNSTAAW